MEPVAFVLDKFGGLGKWSQDFFDGLTHRHARSSSSRNPIDILKRLQREAFSDLMKLRDRQDKVERMLSFYRISKGSPNQEGGTLVRGEVDSIGALLMIHNADHENIDLLRQAGIRTGLDSRFTFELNMRDKDTLSFELLSSHKGNINFADISGCPLSLAKVFYTAHVSDWLSVYAIPVGAQCRDVAIVTNPSHQGKGLTDLSSSGPPILNQHKGIAIGFMVQKSNILASLSQGFHGPGPQLGSDRHWHCLSTFGQALCQFPRGIKLSLLGLLQVPKLSAQNVNQGALTISFGDFKLEQESEQMLEAFSHIGTDSTKIVSSRSIALMLESDINDTAKIGGWIEMQKSNLRYLQWSVNMSNESEDSFGWGVRLGGMAEYPTNWEHFLVESYIKLNVGKNLSMKPGIGYIRQGSARASAFMLRSNWSF